MKGSILYQRLIPASIWACITETNNCSRVPNVPAFAKGLGGDVFGKKTRALFNRSSTTVSVHFFRLVPDEHREGLHFQDDQPPTSISDRGLS